MDIYLLDDKDPYRGRNVIGVNLREKKLRMIISKINVLSSRNYYEYKEMDDKIKVYDTNIEDFKELFVIDKSQIEGDEIGWIIKILEEFKELKIIEKNKYYIKPEEITVLLENFNKLREKIGEGDKEKIFDMRFGYKILLEDYKWSKFWDALYYYTKQAEKYNLYLYIPLIESLYEES